MASPEISLEQMPRVGLYFLSANRLSYLIAKTLALGGCRVWVRFEVSLSELLAKPNESGCIEREYCSWLFSDRHIEILENGCEAPEVDCLLYQVEHTRPRYPKELLAWMEKARWVTAWNTNYAEKIWWQFLIADLVRAVRSAEFLRRTRRVVMACGRTGLRPTALFSRTYRQGYFVHPKFLHEPELYAEMFDAGWSAESQRPVRLIFSGNPVPEARRQLIAELKSCLIKRSRVHLIDHYEKLQMMTTQSPNENEAALVLWMVRADPQDPQWSLRRDVIPPAQWPSMLRMCDFAFCPPGDERKTHRVVEALLQGVIPILDCPEEYDLGLRDGINCLVVRNRKWAKVLHRALDMRTEEIIRLRKAVQELALAELHPVGTARRWLQRLGLDSVEVLR
jgi:hypothetical protein